MQFDSREISKVLHVIILHFDTCHWVQEWTKV
jgi:hypothetical protein